MALTYYYNFTRQFYVLITNTCIHIHSRAHLSIFAHIYITFILIYTHNHQFKPKTKDESARSSEETGIIYSDAITASQTPPLNSTKPG